MFSLLKTILFLGIFLVQFSSAVAIPRSDWRSYHNRRPKSTSSDVAIPTTTIEASLPTSVPDLEDSCEIDDSDLPANTSPVETAASTLIPVISVPAPTTEAALPTISPIISIQTPTPTATTPVVVTPSSSTQASAIAQPTSTQAAGALWQPAVGATWQIELSGVVSDTSYAADIFDIDLFDSPKTTIDALHAAGKKVICYFSAGSFENWRPDQADFQAGDKGSGLDGWAGEWWLNTNTANVRSIMATRMDLAASKGCDAVDPDNVDGYANANGVGLTSADAVDYLNFLADTAHAKGLSIGLKNAGGLVGDVLGKMQFHVNEQCLEFNECNLFKPFIDAGKPVFHIEYPESAPSIAASLKSEKCSAATTLKFSTVLKTEALNAWVDAC